jgi:hypothetical protein
VIAERQIRPAYGTTEKRVPCNDGAVFRQIEGDMAGGVARGEEALYAKFTQLERLVRLERCVVRRGLTQGDLPSCGSGRGVLKEGFIGGMKKNGDAIMLFPDVGNGTHMIKVRVRKPDGLKEKVFQGGKQTRCFITRVDQHRFFCRGAGENITVFLKRAHGQTFQNRFHASSLTILAGTHCSLLNERTGSERQRTNRFRTYVVRISRYMRRRVKKPRTKPSFSSFMTWDTPCMGTSSVRQCSRFACFVMAISMP